MSEKEAVGLAVAGGLTLVLCLVFFGDLTGRLLLMFLAVVGLRRGLERAEMDMRMAIERGSWTGEAMTLWRYRWVLTAAFLLLLLLLDVLRDIGSETALIGNRWEPHRSGD